MQHHLYVEQDGQITGLYTDLIDLTALGRVTCERASTVEWNVDVQQWEVRLPDGTLIHQNANRQAALRFEVDYLQRERMDSL